MHVPTALPVLRLLAKGRNGRTLKMCHSQRVKPNGHNPGEQAKPNI